MDLSECGKLSGFSGELEFCAGRVPVTKLPLFNWDRRGGGAPEVVGGGKELPWVNLEKALITLQLATRRKVSKQFF